MNNSSLFQRKMRSKGQMLAVLEKLIKDSPASKEDVWYLLSTIFFRLITDTNHATPFIDLLSQDLSLQGIGTSFTLTSDSKGKNAAQNSFFNPNMADFSQPSNNNVSNGLSSDLKRVFDNLDAREAFQLLLEEDLLGTFLEEHVVSNRKARGMFFTPPEIIEKILSETLDLKANSILAKLKEKVTNTCSKKDKNAVIQYFHEALTQLQGIRIVDPACGSGNFLVRSAEKLKMHYLELARLWNDLEISELPSVNDSPEFISIIRHPVKLLLCYILPQLRGIDKDSRAVFLTRLKLFLLAFNSNALQEQVRDLALSITCLLQWTIQQGDALVHFPLKTQLIALQDQKIRKKIAMLANSWNEKETWLKRPSTTKEFFMKCQKLRKSIEIMLEDKKKDPSTKILPEDAFNWALAWWDAFINVNQEEKVVLKRNKGFSIIIGNPPYFSIRGKGRGALKRTWYHDYFKNDPFWKQWFRSQADIYYFFMIDALQHLQAKGLLGFIVEDYWIENDHADRLKRYLLARSRVKKIVKLDNFSAFVKATHSTVIIILSKIQATQPNEVEVELHSSLSSLLNRNDKSESIFFSVPHSILGEGKWTISPHWKKFWKLRKNGHLILPLGDLSLDAARKYPMDFDLDLDDPQIRKRGKIEGIAHVLQGMSPGKKEIFVLSRIQAERWQLEPEFLRPLLVNSDIDQYVVNARDRVIIYPRLIKNLEDVPHIRSYLFLHKPKLTEGSDRKKLLSKNKIRWFDFNVYRNYLHLENASLKIVCPYRSKQLRFALDDQKSLFTTDCYGIISKKEVTIDHHYLLGLLNSSIIAHWYEHCGKRKGNMLELFSTPLRRIPIIVPSQSDQQHVKRRVLEIIKKKSIRKEALSNSDEEKKEMLAKIRDLQSEINEKLEELYGF